MRQLRDKMGLTKDLIKIIDAGGEEGGDEGGDEEGDGGGDGGGDEGGGKAKEVGGKGGEHVPP